MSNARYTLALCLLLVIDRSAAAFNFRNHYITGYLAYELLSPEVKQTLENHFESTRTLRPVRSQSGAIDAAATLGRLAYWADEERGRERSGRSRYSTGPHHYVNVHIEIHTGYSDDLSDPDDAGKGGLILVMDRHLDTLKASERTVEYERAFNFLVHFVGDLHQPLHVGHRGDRGGNDVEIILVRRRTNLHAAWDGGITDLVYPSSAPARSPATDDRLLQEVRARLTPQNVKAWQTLPQGGLKPAFREWANESFVVARDEVYRWPRAPGQRQEDRREILSGMRLPQEYADANSEVIQERLARAAARLALVLETVLVSDR